MGVGGGGVGMGVMGGTLRELLYLCSALMFGGEGGGHGGNLESAVFLVIYGVGG